MAADSVRDEVESQAWSDAIRVAVGGLEVAVPPPCDWPIEALRALRFGDYEAWARHCLKGAGYRQWRLADPTIEECEDFIDEWMARSGQDLEGAFRTWSMLDDHAGAVEADLQRYYGTDLRDLWRPDGGASRLTWRRLKVLVDGLPGESLTKTAVRDALDDDELMQMADEPPRGHGPWSQTDLLLASAIDHLKWVIFAVYAAQGGKPRKPEPTPRPGVKRSRKRLGAEQFAHLQRLRDEHEALHGDTSGRVIQLPGTSSETG